MLMGDYYFTVLKCLIIIIGTQTVFTFHVKPLFCLLLKDWRWMEKHGKMKSDTLLSNMSLICCELWSIHVTPVTCSCHVLTAYNLWFHNSQNWPKSTHFEPFMAIIGPIMKYSAFANYIRTKIRFALLKSDKCSLTLRGKGQTVWYKDSTMPTLQQLPSDLFQRESVL